MRMSGLSKRINGLKNCINASLMNEGRKEGREGGKEKDAEYKESSSVRSMNGL